MENETKKSLLLLIAFLLGLLTGIIVGHAMVTGYPYNDVEDERYWSDSNIACACDTLTDWSIMQLAIIKVESEYDPSAIGKAGDYGLYQITGIYTDEVNRIVGDSVFSHEDAFDPYMAMDMFGIYQSHHNGSHDIDKAIYLHNPKGYDRGYSSKVMCNMEEMKKYEELRKNFIKRQ